MMERKKYKVLTTEHQGIGIHFSPGNTLPIHLESTNLKGKGDQKKKKSLQQQNIERQRQLKPKLR